tara:strand:- start:387 stop:497 length:111 start_codon:yes stop_codon:yes gene_type:complete
MAKTRSKESLNAKGRLQSVDGFGHQLATEEIGAELN